MAAGNFDRIVRLGKDTLIYGLGSIVGRLLNFLLVPLYTNFLLREEYGIIANVYAYIAFAAVLYGCGMEGAYMRFIADKPGKKEIFSVPFLSLTGTSLVLSILLTLWSAPIAVLIGMSETEGTIITLAAWILFLDTMMLLPYAALRMERRPAAFAMTRVVNIVINVVFTLIFLAGLKWRAEGVLAANAVASGLTLVILMPVVKRNFSFSFEKPLFKELVAFGLPLIPAGLAGIAMQVVDRPIVKALAGDAMLGVYQANYRLGIFMMLVAGMFDYAWRPFFLNHAKDPDAKRLFSSVFTYLTGAMAGIFLLVAFFIGDLVRINFSGYYFIHPSYWEGLAIVPWILAAYIFVGAYTNFNVGVTLEKKTSYLPFITGVGALLNIGLNLVLIPRFGIQGAAASTFASYGVMATAMYVASQKFYYVTYEWKKILAIAISAAALYALFSHLDLTPFTWAGVGVKLLLLTAYSALLMLFGIARPSQFRRLVGTLTGR